MLPGITGDGIARPKTSVPALGTNDGPSTWTPCATPVTLSPEMCQRGGVPETGKENYEKPGLT